MALDHAVEQEAVSKEFPERGSAESPTALERAVEKEAAQQGAAAMLQEPDVFEGDWGDGAVRVDVDDFCAAGDLLPGTMVKPASGSPVERLGLDVLSEKMDVFPDYLMAAAGEA